MKNKIIIFILLFSFSLSKANNLNHSLNTFGIDLYKIISNESILTSSMISPSSISYALMMVSQGASNETYSEILNVLNIKQNDINNFISTYQIEDSLLIMSNSIWIQNDNCYQPNKTYIDILQNKFNGNISYVNFYNDRLQIIDNINKWVEKFTYGTIKNIVSENEIKQSTTQALLNTIYFKNKWIYPFDSNLTKKNNFYVNGDTVAVQMMNKKNKYAYLLSNEFELIELPYEKDISMYIFLPNEDIELETFIDDFNYEKFKSSLNELTYDLGNIYIPKFDLSYSVSLKDYLPKMGMVSAFNPNQAEFDRFWDYANTCKKYPPKHYIDLINHKSYISNYEEGTEASAATVVVINRVTSIRPNKYFNFVANRPFLYIIYDKNIDNILFIGNYSG